METKFQLVPFSKLWKNAFCLNRNKIARKCDRFVGSYLFLLSFALASHSPLTVTFFVPQIWPHTVCIAKCCGWWAVMFVHDGILVYFDHQWCFTLQFKYLVLYTSSWFICWQGKREEEGRSRKLRRALCWFHPASLSPFWVVGKSFPRPSHRCILSSPPHLSYWHQEAPDRSRQALFDFLQTTT